MLEGEEYCDVCKAELNKGPKLVFAVDEDDEVETQILCPICHQNYIKPDEQMCSKCADEMDFKNDQVDLDKDEEWKNYLDDTAEEDEAEEDDEDMLSLNKLAEEEGTDMFEEEEEDEEEVEPVDDEPDDFDTGAIDPSDFEESDEDEEEEEDEGDEDF